MKRFMLFECGNNGGMETLEFSDKCREKSHDTARFIDSFPFNTWELDDRNELVEWIKEAKIGEMLINRVGNIVRLADTNDERNIDYCFKMLFNEKDERYYNGFESFWEYLGEDRQNPIIGHYVCHMALDKIRQKEYIGVMQFLLKQFDCSYYIDSMIELIINKSEYDDMLFEIITNIKHVRDYELIEKSEYLIVDKMLSLGYSDNDIYKMCDEFDKIEDDYVLRLIKILSHLTSGGIK